MTADFNSFLGQANSAATSNEQETMQEQFRVRTGLVLKLGVYDIKPIKSEVQALGDVGDFGDPRTMVPWKAGIVINMLCLAAWDPIGDPRKQYVRKMYELDGNQVKFPFGLNGIKHFAKISRKDIEMGYARIIKPEGDNGSRSLKIVLPKDFDELDPQTRLSYWLKWLAAMYCIPAGGLNLGTYFYAFVKFSQDKYENWRTDLTVSMKDKDGVYQYVPSFRNPSLIGTVSIDELNFVASQIINEREKKKADELSFPGPGESYPSESSLGF